ncbi:MAG TPA: TlpA disulfide reductase family protein [Phycisphaerae bacterium]|nr:TlpA disulfide reductase family protein [Phycisphaerae bacterium]
MAISRRLSAALLAAALSTSLIAGFLPSVWGQAATQPAARDAHTLVTELKAADEALRDVMPSLDAVADPTFRSTDGQKALPILKKITGLFGEIAQTQAGTPDQRATIRCQYQYWGVMTALGDADALKNLQSAASGSDPNLTSAAKSWLALGQWWAHSTDAPAQTKILDSLTTEAHANPASDDIAGALLAMANSGAANDDLRTKAIDTIKNCLTGPLAKSTVDALASLQGQQQMEADAEKAQADALGKPLDIKGRTSTDGQFDTASLKGKVVMIDFWATWCGPCRAELPNVKAAYQKYHDKGFDIVGVSCDMDDKGLNDFTSDNDMPWVQLRDSSQTSAETEWNPIAKQYGVLGIPTMFLIDKKGVLRYIDARDNLDAKVAKLLAEPDAPATAPAQ